MAALSGRLKSIAVLITLLALLAGAGCVMEESRRRKGDAVMPAHDTSTQIKQQDGLDLKIIDFSWSYKPGSDQILVTGTVENMTGQGLQAIIFYVEAYDQFDLPLGIVESYLRPTYIPAGKTANFDFYLEKGDWVKSLHLRYYFKPKF